MTTIKDLKFDDKNFNKHTEFGMSLLEKSLRENGAGRSILLDKDNNIIAGNGIVEAAGQIGLEKVKIVEATGDEIIAVKRTDISLNSHKGREMALADNATAAVDLDWDDEAIKSEFTEEETKGWGVDLDWNDVEEIIEDEAPEVNDSEPADSELGKVYQLGEHRLMCGDSTDSGTVATLMDGQKADMVFTDPPYKMTMGGGGCFEKNVERMVERTSELVDFDAESIGWIARSQTKNVLIFTSKDLVPDYLRIFSDWNFNILVWTKTNPTPFTHNVFLPDVEYLLYFYQNGRIWNNSVKPTNVYSKFYSSPKTEGRNGAGDLHPTMKPQKLLCDKIRILSNDNGLVLDLFGGSGSTLIACEQTGRKCYMMELDPKYCDVIRKRYWKFKTGREEGWQDGTKAIL